MALPFLYWPPLLFRQVCILTLTAGMLGPRHPLAALTAALLLGALTFPAAPKAPPVLTVRRAVALSLLCLSFALGYGLALRAEHALPTASDPPPWVVAAVSPDGPGLSAPDASFTRGVPLTGRLRESDRMPGGRLRLILDQVRPVGLDGSPVPDLSPLPALPGRLALTWQDPPPDIDRAGPGQILHTTLRVREVRAFANPGLWETESYWRGRGVLYRAWTKGDGGKSQTASGDKSPAYRISGEARPLWPLRESLRLAVLKNLPQKPREKTHSASAKTEAPTQAAAIIPALLFGDRSLCDPATLNLVAKATLAHSLALSGMHLGFAAALGYAAAGLLGLWRPGLFLRLPRQKASLLLAAPVCVVYLWLGGYPPSLLRAALMLLFWGWLLWWNQPKVLMDGLIWAVAVIVLWDPLSIYDLRLQLSAGSVAGIALAAPLLDRLYRLGQTGHRPDAHAHGTRDLDTLSLNEPGGLPANGDAPAGPWQVWTRRLLWSAAATLGISVAAQTAIAPLLLDAFSGTGLWLPLNLLWLPALGLVVMPLAFAGLLCTGLALAGLFMFSPLATVFFWLAQQPCAALLTLLHGLDTLGLLAAPVALRPAWPAWAGYWLLLALLLSLAVRRAFTRRTACLTALGMALLIGPSLYESLRGFAPSVRVQLVDVGQGQAVLLSWQGIQGQEGRVLVDGGGFAGEGFDIGRSLITPLLTANRAPELTWIVSTHADTDHLQGLLFPLQSFQVGGFAQSRAESPQERAFGQASHSLAAGHRERILRARGIAPALWQAGDTIALAPELFLEVLHPPAGMAGSASSNNASLALRLVWQGKGLVFIASDLEKSGLRRLLEQSAAKDLNAEILVLPHHGSGSSLDPALYAATRPRLALASCGYANQWHFPALSVRRALAERNIPLETTADRGQISVTWHNGAQQQSEIHFAR